MGDLNTVRTELTVLPADPLNQVPLGWSVCEYLGSRIGKELDEKGRPVPLTRKEDLSVGDEILVGGLHGYLKMTVAQDEDDSLYAESEKLLSMLKFGGDDRECWVGVGLINKRAFAKLFPGPEVP